MRSWVVDASIILEQGDKLDIKNGDLTITNSIKMFLDDDNYNFIIAPKGFGKTILMIYKRLSYDFNNKTGFKFIPSDGSLVDLPKGGAANLNLSNPMIKFYKDQRNWEYLWRACISLSIINIIRKSSIDANYGVKEDFETLEKIRTNKNGKYSIINQLIYEDVYKTPLSYLNHILLNFKRDDILHLFKEQAILDELISDIKIPIAIFIDNADEYFVEHSEKDGQNYNPSVRGMFDIDLWHISQHGLIFAIKHMCRSNHHLDIFASIRKEAYEKLSGPNVENIRGQFLDVKYSFQKLKDIFENNIRWMDKEYASSTFHVGKLKFSLPNLR